MANQTAKDVLNHGNPNDFNDGLRKVQFGTSLTTMYTPVEAEAFTTTVDVATLAYKPLIVQGVNVLTVTGGGGPTTGYSIIPSGQTPATTEVAVNHAAGTLTFAAADKVLTGTVQYIKKDTTLVGNLAQEIPKA